MKKRNLKSKKISFKDYYANNYHKFIDVIFGASIGIILIFVLTFWIVFAWAAQIILFLCFKRKRRFISYGIIAITIISFLVSIVTLIYCISHWFYGFSIPWIPSNICMK